MNVCTCDCLLHKLIIKRTSPGLNYFKSQLFTTKCTCIYLYCHHMFTLRIDTSSGVINKTSMFTLNIVYFSLFNILNIFRFKLYIYSVLLNTFCALSLNCKSRRRPADTQCRPNIARAAGRQNCLIVVADRLTSSVRIYSSTLKKAFGS